MMITQPENKNIAVKSITEGKTKSGLEIPDGDHDTRKDADLKRDKLTPLIATIQPHRIVLFDDSASVRAMGESMGFHLIVDSVQWNRQQQAKKVMAI